MVYTLNTPVVDIDMRSTINRWGNSLGLRIPKAIAEAAALQEGSSVTIEVENGSIRVTPVRHRPTLRELLADEPAARPGEADWGPAKGKESW